MPRGDKTGPPRGGGGGGRGWRNMYYYATGLPGWARYGGYAPFCPYPSPYGEADRDAAWQSLETQADALQVQLDLVKKRLTDLETDATTE